MKMTRTLFSRSLMLRTKGVKIVRTRSPFWTSFGVATPRVPWMSISHRQHPVRRQLSMLRRLALQQSRQARIPNRQRRVTSMLFSVHVHHSHLNLSRKCHSASTQVLPCPLMLHVQIRISTRASGCGRRRSAGTRVSSAPRRQPSRRRCSRCDARVPNLNVYSKLDTPTCPLPRLHGHA